MDIPMDEEQLLLGIVHTQVRECRSDLNRIKDIVKRGIANHRSGLTSVKDILEKDVEEFVHNVQQVATINIVSLGGFISALLITWHLFCLIWKTEYDFCVVIIKLFTERDFEDSLSNVDHAWIVQKYLSCCSESWFEEVESFLKENHESQISGYNPNYEGLEALLDSLDIIQDLSQIPEPHRELKYYKLLMKNRHLIGRDREKSLVRKFKNICLELIIAHSHAFRVESYFVEVLVTFLRAFKNTRDVIAKLKLQEFCSNDLPLGEFLEIITNLSREGLDADVRALQDAADNLKQEENPFLTNTSKNLIKAYVKPVEIRKSTLDGRLVIEATGKIIVVSDILRRLEALIQINSDIEEVRFVGGDIIYIDANLENEIWHGKNIVILAETIQIYDEVIWDVSGKDSVHIYPDNAGCGEDGCGKPGADGYAGESGGNVLIAANQVVDSESFTIISNGGKGSKGQDGGDGTNGEDGTGIMKAEFDIMFPSVVKLFDISLQRKIETDENIRQLAAVTNVDWTESTGSFIDVTTQKKNQITFSYASGGWCTCCQALLLYEGSLGLPGGRGGEYGRGGQRGYSGEIISSNTSIIEQKKPGASGAIGKGGLYGDPGKNGWDMGYTDYQTWTQAVLYGNDEKTKIQLKYHDSSWSGSPRCSVWCPYRGEYAEIVCTRIEHKERKQYQERMDTRQNSELQHHAQATKKKSISRGKILADYSHCYNSVERTMLPNFRSSFDNIIQRAIQAMIDNAQQQEKVTTELKVKRLVKSIPQDRNNFRTANAMSHATSRDNTYSQSDIQRLIHELTSNLTLGNYRRLKSAEITRSALLDLFHGFDTLNRRSSLLRETENADDVRNLKQLLIAKYRFATLREIAQDKYLPGNYNDVTDSGIQVTAESVSRYLVVDEENVNEILHPILGTFNQYFYTNGDEHREKICQFCEEMSQDTEDEPLKRSVRTFVLKAGKSDRVRPNVEKYYIEYTEFLGKHLHKLEIFLEPLRRELELHKDILALWVQRNDDESIRFELNRKILNHKFLNFLYTRFNKQLAQSYDWSRCWGDKDFLEEYYNDIRKSGPLSKSYRELLARVFEVNIRLYRKDQDNRFCSLDNHNPTAKQAIHILIDKNQLKQLKIDVNFLRLEQERVKTSKIYAQILAKSNTFNERQELDHYFDTKTFLPNDVLEDNGTQQYSYENEDLCSEEQAILEIIKHFSCPDERWQLKGRLRKISSQYIGQNRILHYILKRFGNDGRHVTYQELCSLVNSILAFVVDDKNYLNIFCWIVAAYPQNNWTDELVLLQIENHLKNRFVDKPKWRDYLSKVTDKNILLSLKSKLSQPKINSAISIGLIEENLRLLSSIPHELVNLDGIELSEWPYVMKEKYWTHKLSPLSNGNESEKLSGASYYLLTMENIFCTSLVTKFIETLVTKAPSPDTLTDILLNFCNGNWILSIEEVETLSNLSVDDWMKEMWKKFATDETERGVTRLVEIMTGNGNNSEEIRGQLPEIEKSILRMREREHATDPGGIASSVARLVAWVKAKNTYEQGTFDGSCGISDDVRIICKFEDKTSKYRGQDMKIINFRTLYYGIIFPEYLKTFLGDISDEEKKEFLEDARADMLAAIDDVVELKRGFKLHDTQKLAILTLLTNEHDTLAQVSTGEGKTLIVIGASIMKALHGERVDVITSSSVLAKRDAEANQDIYGSFGITVSHNCSEDIDQRKATYSSCEVVYGDLSSFQRDYLLDQFYGKNILGDRRFDNVFADEVDSMLLDNGNNMLYLSHDLAGLDKLESIYLYIWQCVSRPARSSEDYSSIFNVEAIKKAVLDDLYGLLTKEDIQKIDPTLDEQQVNLIWEGLVRAAILDKQTGKMLKEKIGDEELETILSPAFGNYKNRLSFLLKERVERVKHIRVPNYLKPFIEQHLETWIASAVTATLMPAGHDYVMDVDRTGISQDLNPNVTIVDRDTGIDQINSQWDEALHQFLQLKHGSKVSMQSLKAVFISSVSYFKLYRNLYGLTGTLGSQRERASLLEIHNVHFVTIPTARSKQFLEEPPIHCANENEWIEKIFKKSKAQTEDRGRSVLIICETIDAAEILHREFLKAGTKHVHIYRRDHEEFDIAQGKKEMEQGRIIIATNLAGRGTDIKITNKLKKAGGLHVCLTYLPKNSRLEEQAFGRAARKGDEGSGQLIIMGSSARECGNANILELKRDRDFEESRRISVLQAHYETQIMTEEHCFKEFTDQFGKLTKKLEDSNAGTEVTKILLQTCLDLWAFWLDKNSKCMKNVKDEESERNLEISLNEFISQFEDFDYDNSNWLNWVENQPIQMNKIGKCFCQAKKYDQAIELFNKVIQSEPNFSEAAHYYKAFALVRKSAIVEAKADLREAARLFDEHSKFSMYAGGTIKAIKKHNEKRSIIQVDTYAKQQNSLSNLYYMFSQSVGDVFDKPITPESFLNKDITETLSECIYEDLLRYDILRKPKIKMNITEEAWNKISLDYEISVSELKNYLSGIKGEVIDEKELLELLKINVKLPSRENFWKLLIEQGILHQEVKCVIVDVGELEKIDSSLLDLLRGKIANRELREQTLEHNVANGIILHTEQSVLQNDCIIVEKSPLQTLMAEYNRKYEFLKEKGVFSVNRKALVDTSKISSTSFSRYDSITLEDFTATNLPVEDAEQIFAELVEQKVLQEVISSDGIYRLGIPTNEIDRIQLSSYPVYQNAVKKLLSRCFIYRIALDGIEKQLELGNFPVNPRLTSHPHHKIIYELLSHRIIKPAKFLKRTLNDLHGTLREIYSRTISSRTLEHLISQSGLIWNESNPGALCEHLVEKKWLSTQTYSTDAETDVHSHNYFEVELASCFGLKYTINVSTERKALTSFVIIEKKMEQIFDNRLLLAEKSIIEHIVEVLEQSISPLKTLESPDGTLKPLTDYNGLDASRHIEEVNIFTLNGLDQVLVLDERKWTWKMMVNTGIVVAMGVGQIAVGAVMEVLSWGGLTCGAVAVAGEGIGDIIFAISAYRSGHFSWKAYIQHKVQSIMLTATTGFLGSFFAASAQVGGAQLAGITGRELIEQVGLNGVAMSVGKIIVSKTLTAVAAGLSYTGIDALVQDFGKKICTGISSTFLSGITSKVMEHDISTSLGNIYQLLGKERAMGIINDLTTSSLNEESLMEKYFPIVSKAAHAANVGIKQAATKICTGGKNIFNLLASIFDYILAFLPWIGRAACVIEIRNITGNILDNMQQKIQRVLQTHGLRNPSRQNVPDREQVKGCANFKREVIEQWNSRICENAARIIEQNVVRPVLNEGVPLILRQCEKIIENQCRSYDVGQHDQLAKERKREYQESERTKNTSTTVDDNVIRAECTEANEYHKNVNKLIAKTNNRQLFADAVREHIPIDVTCLDACTRVVREVSGIEGLTVIVKREDGTAEKFTSSVNGVAEKRVVELELIDNRFRLHESNVSRCNGNIEFGSNCLYEAVTQHINLNISRESFTVEVANCIERDKRLCHIEQSYDSFSTYQYAFSGKRVIKMSDNKLCKNIKESMFLYEV